MPTFFSLWSDAEPRIAAGIEQHRKSDASIRVQDAAGRPLPNVPVTIEQTSSSFLFGANAFMLGGYPTPDLNARYEEAFTNLFNSATIPFYWRDLEPVPGQLRFAEGSRPIHRRPPPDRVLAFAKKHHLSTVGHPLVWDFNQWSAPDWLPMDPVAAAPLWEKRIAQIAERYGSDVARWDVVNEVCLSAKRCADGRSKPMLDNHARHAFRWAERYLPPSAFLMINETANCWYLHLHPYAQLIKGLIDDGARVSGIGLQLHCFSDAENMQIWRGEKFVPADLFTALDHFAQFNRPLHISEITLTAPGSNAEGEEIQATIARNFYRLWFSHPAVHAITWWNMPDGGAAPGEDSVASGLVRRDFSPKLSYRALHDLIRKDWRTRLTATTDPAGRLTFRGFHGTYTIQAHNKSTPLTLTPDKGASTTLTLP